MAVLSVENEMKKEANFENRIGDFASIKARKVKLH